MIQQINESEKNRILNLHRQHFILNEETENKVTPENAYKELKKLNVNSTMDGIRYYDKIKFGDLTIEPINFHLLGRSEEPIELIKQNTVAGEVFQVKYKDDVIINFTSDEKQPYIPHSRFISK